MQTFCPHPLAMTMACPLARAAKTAAGGGSMVDEARGSAAPPLDRRCVAVPRRTCRFLESRNSPTMIQLFR